MADIQVTCPSNLDGGSHAATYVQQTACNQFYFGVQSNQVMVFKSTDAGLNWDCGTALTDTCCYPDVATMAAWHEGVNSDCCACPCTVHIAFKYGTCACSNVGYLTYDLGCGTVTNLQAVDTCYQCATWDARYPARLSSTRDGGHIDIVRAEGGNVYLTFTDHQTGSGTTHPLYRSTNGGACWAARTSLTCAWGELKLFPDTQAADANDLIAIIPQLFNFNTAVRVWKHDDSGNSWSQSTTACTELNSNDSCTPVGKGFGAARRFGYNFLTDTGDLLFTSFNDVGFNECGESCRDVALHRWDYSCDQFITTIVCNDDCTKDKQGGLGILVNRNDECEIWLFNAQGKDGACPNTEVKYWASTDRGATFDCCPTLITDDNCTGPRGGTIAVPWDPKVGQILFNESDVVRTNVANAFTIGCPSFTVGGLVVSCCPSNECEVRAHISQQLTITGTLTCATWKSCVGSDDPQTEELLYNLVSAQSEVRGWNNVVRGQCYKSVVLADCPVGYWRGGSGNLADCSTNSNCATGTGTSTGPDLLLASGQDSARFDALGDKLVVCDTCALQNIFACGGTVEAVVLPLSAGLSPSCVGRIVAKIDSCCNIGWELGVCDTNATAGFVRYFFRHSFNCTTGVWITTGETPKGTQAHVAVTYNKGSVCNDPTFYVNGVVHTVANGLLTEDTTPVGTASSDACRNLGIGARCDAVVSTFDGSLQEVALYDTALSTATVRAHVNAASKRYGLQHFDITRCSDTVVTVTMPKFGAYDITATETITWTAPAASTSVACDLTGCPTFDICPTDFTGPPLGPPTPCPCCTLCGCPTGDGSPFGGVNGGLGPLCPDGVRRLGEGDDWRFNNPGLDVGLLAGGTTVRVLRLQVAEVHQIC